MTIYQINDLLDSESESFFESLDRTIQLDFNDEFDSFFHESDVSYILESEDNNNSKLQRIKETILKAVQFCIDQLIKLGDQVKLKVDKFLINKDYKSKIKKMMKAAESMDASNKVKVVDSVGMINTEMKLSEKYIQIVGPVLRKYQSGRLLSNDLGRAINAIDKLNEQAEAELKAASERTITVPPKEAVQLINDTVKSLMETKYYEKTVKDLDKIQSDFRNATFDFVTSKVAMREIKGEEKKKRTKKSDYTTTQKTPGIFDNGDMDCGKICKLFKKTSKGLRHNHMQAVSSALLQVGAVAANVTSDVNASKIKDDLKDKEFGNVAIHGGIAVGGKLIKMGADKVGLNQEENWKNNIKYTRNRELLDRMQDIKDEYEHIKRGE